MPGPHSGPYLTQHPNATDAEKAAQAVEILERLGKGESTRSVAAAMGINRSTLFERLRMINQPLPCAGVVRVIHFERLESMFEGLGGRLDGDASNADYARLVAEQRQVLARQSALLRVEATEPDPSAGPDDPEVTEWVAAEHEESEDELRRVRNGDETVGR